MVRDYSFSDLRIDVDVMVEDSIQAHADKGVLPQPDDGFWGAGHSGDQ
jgi:hypothetical protein